MMRIKQGLMVILIVFIMVSAAWADRLVESKISKVILYSDQALVQRTAYAQVPAGQLQLQLGVDAFYLDRDSVTAKINGAGEIFGVQFKKVPLSESPQADLRALEKELETLKKNQRSLMDKKEVLAQKMEFLSGIINFSKTQTAKDLKTQWPKIADLEKIFDFLGNKYQQVYNDQKALDEQLNTLADKIDVVKRKIDAIQNQSPKSRRVIEVLFKSFKPQKIGVTVEYLVKRACWQPLYRVMVSPGLDSAKMNMFAHISQKTGENWEKVSLSVSNVIPLKGIGVPQLYSWQIDIPRPPVLAKTELRANQQDEFIAKQEAMARPAPAEAKAGFASAKKSRSALAFTYELPQPVSIPSHPQKTIAPLFTKKLQGQFIHLAVPKQRPRAYLIGTFKTDKELLAGALNVYLGGRYVGKTYLEEKKAAAPFRLNLGADREVLIKREKIKDKIKESYFGSIERSTVVREIAYNISAENIKDKPVVLHILDNLPVSRTDKIVVKDVELSLKPTQKDYQNREGVYLWELKLAPSAKAEINIAYVLTYPKDKTPADF